MLSVVQTKERKKKEKNPGSLSEALRLLHVKRETRWETFWCKINAGLKWG